MGYKAVCFACRKAFNYNPDVQKNMEQKCPQCSKVLSLVNHKFKLPRKSDNKSWDVAKYLCENGFPYRHVYKDVSKRNTVDENSSSNYVEYPTTMKEAREFIVAYKEQAQGQNHRI